LTVKKAGDSGSPGIAVVQQSEFTHLCGRFKPIMAGSDLGRWAARTAAVASRLLEANREGYYYFFFAAFFLAPFFDAAFFTPFFLAAFLAANAILVIASLLFEASSPHR
jgi:hypothetical protein